MAGVIVIQRVRVRWGAGSRGAAQANLRSGLPGVHEVPPLPDPPLVVHDVLADEATGYRPTAELLVGSNQARAVGLWVECADDAVIVDRLPVPAAYPRRQGPARLFTLKPGQSGRYRANFRFTGCACAPQWHYEQWTIHIANGPARRDVFLDPSASRARDVDDRVHLYGGAARRSTKIASACLD